MTSSNDMLTVSGSNWDILCSRGSCFIGDSSSCLIGDSNMELARLVSDAEWKDEMDEFVSSAKTDVMVMRSEDIPFRLPLVLLLLAALALVTFWIP